MGDAPGGSKSISLNPVEILIHLDEMKRKKKTPGKQMTGKRTRRESAFLSISVLDLPSQTLREKAGSQAFTNIQRKMPKLIDSFAFHIGNVRQTIFHAVPGREVVGESVIFSLVFDGYYLLLMAFFELFIVLAAIQFVLGLVVRLGFTARIDAVSVYPSTMATFAFARSMLGCVRPASGPS